jgi:ABC-2 type transport system ATP-binding protein
MSILVTNLSKMYGPQIAVNAISFSIAKGEIVGFLGPNGAGKSTTMKMITGYLGADAGSISVAGEKVSTDTLSAKKKMGYLPEANPLYYDMYVREYLAFIASVHELKNSKQAIEQVIQSTGLTIEANKKIGQLSKGYKQRVGLAAALIHDPEVLILDEPTAGLDPNQLAEIRALIQQLGKNKTILFSSHILQEVQAICDRVIIIDKGNLVADDTLSNLQKTTNGNTIVTVAFKEIVDVSLLNELINEHQVNKIRPTTDHSRGLEGSSFQLTTSQPDMVKTQLLELSLKNKLNIVSLQSETNSLENIFRNLTSNTHTK